ncbi:RlmE family RNA methyltransferase [Bacteriovoracaceae bacterium]|nr:RlmE family RNA methyltransferase [Bacteriovoracaceae bacterium]
MSFKVKDHYFKKAKKEGFAARSVYKLQEIDEKFKVLKKGQLILDCGYYPGSWMQYTSEKIGQTGKVVGIDIQEVNEKMLMLGNVELFQKDLFNINSLEEIGIDRKFNVVLSDMAPKTTGNKLADQMGSLNLVEKLFTLLPGFLEKNGCTVMKIFESQDAQEFLRDSRKLFKELKYYRPKSTRGTSKEYFAIGINYQG